MKIENINIPLMIRGNLIENAIEMFLAGASAVQIGSANFSNPYVMLEVIEGIEKYLMEKGYNSIQDIIGLVKN